MKQFILIVLLISFTGYSKVYDFKISSLTNQNFEFPLDQNITFYIINKNNNNFSDHLKSSLITHLGESGFGITNDSLRANVFLESNIVDNSENKTLINLIIKDKKQNIFWKASLKDNIENLKGTEPYITKSMMWTLGKNFSGEVKVRKSDNQILTKYKWQKF